MTERAEYVSIAEAATLLGVHRNTVRNRIRAGRYKAHKLVTPQGKTYAIARESLDLRGATPTNAHAQSLSGVVHHNADNPPQPAALVSPDQQAQADAIVQRLLAPFIAELGTVREELGRVKAERDARDETIAALRRRAEAAEAERERLQQVQEARRERAKAHVLREQQSMQVRRSGALLPDALDRTADMLEWRDAHPAPPPPSPTPWARLRAFLRGDD